MIGCWIIKDGTSPLLEAWQNCNYILEGKERSLTKNIWGQWKVDIQPEKWNMILTWIHKVANPSNVCEFPNIVQNVKRESLDHEEFLMRCGSLDNDEFKWKYWRIMKNLLIMKSFEWNSCFHDNPSYRTYWKMFGDLMTSSKVWFTCRKYRGFSCFGVNNQKSGIGSCIAPKAGLARPPAKGRFGAGASGLLLWCSS